MELRPTAPVEGAVGARGRAAPRALGGEPAPGVTRVA